MNERAQDTVVGFYDGSSSEREWRESPNHTRGLRREAARMARRGGRLATGTRWRFGTPESRLPPHVAGQRLEWPICTRERLDQVESRLLVERSVESLRLLKLINRIESGRSEDLSGLQAADFLAWHTNRDWWTRDRGDKDLLLRMRMIAAGLLCSDRYDYAKLTERYKDWPGRDPAVAYVVNEDSRSSSQSETVVLRGCHSFVCDWLSPDRHAENSSLSASACYLTRPATGVTSIHSSVAIGRHTPRSVPDLPGPLRARRSKGTSGSTRTPGR